MDQARLGIGQLGQVVVRFGLGQCGKDNVDGAVSDLGDGCDGSCDGVGECRQVWRSSYDAQSVGNVLTITGGMEGMVREEPIGAKMSWKGVFVACEASENRFNVVHFPDGLAGIAGLYL